MNPKDKRNYLKPNQDYEGGEGGGRAPGFREELHSKLHTIYGNHKNTETLSDSKQPQNKKYWHPNRIIPEFIKIQGMPADDWQKLANQFGDGDLFEGLKETKSHTKLFGKPRNIAAFITKKCQKYIKKRKENGSN